MADINKDKRQNPKTQDELNSDQPADAQDTPDAKQAAAERDQAAEDVRAKEEAAAEAGALAADAQRELDAAQVQRRDAIVAAADAERQSNFADDLEYDDQGREIGADGERPVSNVNPSKRAIRGVRVF